MASEQPAGWAGGPMVSTTVWQGLDCRTAHASVARRVGVRSNDNMWSGTSQRWRWVDTVEGGTRNSRRVEVSFLWTTKKRQRQLRKPSGGKNQKRNPGILKRKVSPTWRSIGLDFEKACHR